MKYIIFISYLIFYFIVGSRGSKTDYSQLIVLITAIILSFFSTKIVYILINFSQKNKNAYKQIIIKLAIIPVVLLSLIIGAYILLGLFN